VPDLTHLGVIAFGLRSCQVANANKYSQEEKTPRKEEYIFPSGDNQMLLLE